MNRSDISPDVCDMLDALDVVIWEADPVSWQFTFMSKAAEVMFGYPLDSWLNEPGMWLRVLHPDDREATASACREAIDAGRDHALVYRFVTADGRVRWVQDLVRVRRGGSDGRPVRLFGVMVDVTRRKLAEEAVRASEERYVRLWDESHDALYVTTCDGRVVEVNQAAIDLFGFAGRDDALAHTAVEAYADPEERRRFQAVVDVEGAVRDFEVTLRKRSGEAMACLLTATARRSDDGVVIGYRERLRDVSGERRTAVTLRVKTELLQAVAEAMSRLLQNGDWKAANSGLLAAALAQTNSEYGFIGILEDGALRIMTQQGINWHNSENREFYERAQRTYDEVGYLEFRNFDNLFGHVLRTGEPVISNDPAVDSRSGGLPAGHPPLRSFLGVPMATGGNTVGMIGLANRPGGYGDIERQQVEILASIAAVIYESSRRHDHQERLEQQLRQAQKIEAIGRLAGGIAHDFNNILTAIIGHADVLCHSLESSAGSAKADADEILRSANRAAALTRQLLAFSRQQVLQPLVLDVNVTVREMGRFLRRLIGEHIEMSLETGAFHGRLKADPHQLEQVVMNLAVNARDAMPSGGRLTITTEDADVSEQMACRRPPMLAGQYVKLTVADTGVGMDVATQARLFEPFFTTKEQGKGTGLGLAMVYGIVKQSGGYIWVESAPGHGTRCELYFPAVEDEADEPEPIEDQELLCGDETVLLVEDDAAVRQLARQGLEHRGYRVLDAATGDEAIALAEGESGPIHVLVTDLVMPGLDGHEVASRVAERRPGLRILYTSGYSDETLRARLGEKGRGSFLQKPFTTAALARAVATCLPSETSPQTSARNQQGEG